jgi:NAD(P)-dependent dehydrogenase (short-subunit alcohol dehydrogenase family)
MKNPLDLTGKQILITGAAKGIGRATSVLFSRLGAKLILIDIDNKGMDELIKLLEGDNHKTFIFDFKNTDAISEMIREIVSENGPFDGYVHCVGVRCRRPLSMITPAILQDVMKTNFGSFMEIVRVISRKNNFNTGLSIVGISSVSAFSGPAGVSAYAASKAAMDAAVRCLARELSQQRIRLNTVVPAQVNTPEYLNFREMAGNTEDPVLKRQYLGLAEPEDVANVIAFLISDISKFITGTSVPVDGGYLAS